MNKSDIEFAHDAIQAILNTDKTIVGTATVVKDATNGKNAEDIAIVAANTVHSAAELFSKLSVIGVVVNGIEAFNTIYNNWNTSSTLEKAGSVLSLLTAIGTTVAKIHPATALVANALSVGLSMYALATDDSPETEQAVNDLLTAANNLKDGNWSDATSLLQEGKTVADSLISLSNQINDGSIQFVKDGDTLSQIAQDNSLSLNELLALNPQYKANPDDVKAGALLILKDNAGTQSLSDYLKEHTDDPQAFSALIDSLKTELQAASVIRSPLTLDLDGDGMVETTSKENSGVYFDHDNNSFAEQSGWVGKDDGLLVFDKNNNGKIDDGSELFGNNTILSNGNKAANGFEALKDLDSNNDGKIDNQDTNFNNLKIWQDKNSDGKLDEGELLSLSEAGVRSLNTTYSNSNEVDSSNNAINNRVVLPPQQAQITK
ncbi:Alkaline phosphatase (EC [uncultured Gammaproteobacteria bacterium]|nr:Alkaline phosphatase (EC [uncultured Gammaproteobacteria bacterium]